MTNSDRDTRLSAAGKAKPGAGPKPHAERAANLRPFDPGMFPPGQPLPGHVLDAAGRIIVHKGERLSAEQLGRLANRGAYVAEAASVDRSVTEAPRPEHCTIPPEELMQILGRPETDTAGRQYVREHERVPWRVVLNITAVENTDGWERQWELQVTTCDISRGGFCFLCQRFMHVGTVIYPRFEATGGPPVRKALVRNCTHVSGREHRVGAEFVKPKPGERIPFN